MRRSSPRPLSSARARARRRWKTSGEREGSWTGLMRNAECGVRNWSVGLGFRIPNSAFRIGYAAATAPATATNSRRSIVLAPPEGAPYITRPPRRLEGGFPMQFEARIEPLTGKLPKVSYRWDPETDILSVACKGTGKTTGLNGTVDLEGGDGSFVVIDVAGGAIHGVDVVTWPDDIRTRDNLAIPEPAKDGRVVFPGRKSQPRVAAVEVDTALTVEKNQTESVLHIRVGRQRAATVVRAADLLLVEVDKNSRLAGLWFLDVPPCPTVEAKALPYR